MYFPSNETNRGTCVSRYDAYVALEASQAFVWNLGRAANVLQDMSRIEATTIIAAICSRFDISLAPGQVRTFPLHRQT